MQRSRSSDHDHGDECWSAGNGKPTPSRPTALTALAAVRDAATTKERQPSPYPWAAAMIGCGGEPIHYLDMERTASQCKSMTVFPGIVSGCLGRFPKVIRL